MSRPPRLFAPGLLYHVIARGNQRQSTFLDDADYSAYLRRLALYPERHGVSLHAYCLMPNHVHLLVRTGTTPLAKFMQGLQQYTQWSRRRMGRARQSGPTARERARASHSGRHRREAAAPPP